VDEINRGDIPRIVGELLTILARDQRGTAVVRPVPAHVSLSGPMHTADRSISLPDAARRRRVGLVELLPDPTVLPDHTVAGIPLGPWLEALNRRVCEHVGRDARNLPIGPSYRLQGGRPLKDVTAFKRALRDDIIPLLEECCYADFPALQNLLGNGLVDAANRRIRHALFEDGREADLVQALTAASPEILASPEALASQQEEGTSTEEEAEDDGEGADQ
jgi:5-methylcytosine-specific restriction protein B